MKIAFIEAGDKKITNIFQRAKLPRLGLPILGAILKSMGHEVRIYCENLSPIDWQYVLSADLVGISALTPTASRAYELVLEIKRSKPEAVIVGGGPHFSYLPEEALRYFDFIVRGEGEKTLIELVRWLDGQKLTFPNNNIPGLSYRIDQKMFHNPARPPLTPEEMDSLPSPDFSLIEGFKIEEGMVPVSTSRGCPFNCAYCTVNQMFGHGYRFISVERAIAELEKTQEMHPKAKVFFIDDNFAAKHARTKEFLREMIRRKLNISWTAQVRVSLAKDQELLELMQKAGCYMVFLGLESISQKTLDGWHKSQTVGDIEQGLATIRSFGIRTFGMFMLGGDDDDSTTARKTVEFAKKNKIDAIMLWLLVPLPGTPLFKKLESEGRILFGEEGVEKWRKWDGTQAVIRHPKMFPWQLQNSATRALASFYDRSLFDRSLELAKNFVSPFRSWKAKKISFNDFTIALYGWWLCQKAKRSLVK